MITNVLAAIALVIVAALIIGVASTLKVRHRNKQHTRAIYAIRSRLDDEAWEALRIGIEEGSAIGRTAHEATDD